MLFSVVVAVRAEWQATTMPVLTTGIPGDWDDFAVTNPCFVRDGEKVRVFYEGCALREDGRMSAFGIAETANPATVAQETTATRTAWRKHTQNPLFRPELEPGALAHGLSVTRWKDGLWAAFEVERSLTSASLEQLDEAGSWIQLASSPDGLIWYDEGTSRSVPYRSKGGLPLRPCLHADPSGRLLHLWWVDGTSRRSHELYHSTSRDGVSWSKPNIQETSEIAPGELCCVRVQASGDYFLLTAVTSEGAPGHAVITRVSRNARSWQAHGPPMFSFRHEDEHDAPWIEFRSDGARLYYTRRERDGPGELYEAFCPRDAYVQ